MTIDEAIAHCLEVAEENDLAAGTYELLAENNHNAYEKLTAETNSSRCAECAADHRQLAEWLQDYKMLRGEYDNCQLNSIEDYRRETARCKSAYFKVNSELCHMKISLSEYHKEFAEFKRLLKAAVEDMSKKNFCTKVCKRDEFACRVSDTCDFKWRYADEALALIGEDGDTP